MMGSGVLLLLASMVWTVCVVLLLARAYRQGQVLRTVLPCPDREQSERVTVVVPARNECSNIEPCLDALLAQRTGADRTTIVAVDDSSTDGTLTAIRALSRDQPRLRAVACPPLPHGWVGKSHACWFGVKQSVERTEWLCFMDADTRAGPDLIVTALADARAHDLDLLSLLPRQVFTSFAERLLMPCGLYLLAVSQNLGAAETGANGAALATGQFILVKRDLYERAGGHWAVRDDLSEDVAVADRVRQVGGRIALANGERLYATRMYDGWRSLWIGASKNMIDMLDGPGRALAIAAALVVFACSSVALPGLGLSACVAHQSLGCSAAAVAVIGAVISVAFHVGGAVLFRIPFWFGLLYPIGYVVTAAITLDSVRRRLTGRTRWKGRVYPDLAQRRPV